MKIGIGLGLSNVRASGGGPAAIFGANLILWLDAEDGSTLFQDAAGATPVTTAGQSVGRWADKSGNNNHANQAGSNKPTYEETAGLGRVAFAKASNHCLFTNAIDLTGTDEISIFALVSKSAGVGTSIIAELSTDYNSKAGSFYLVTDDGGSRRWASASRGTATAVQGQIAFSTVADPDIALLSITHDISGNLSTMRRNGVAETSGTADKGTGNFRNDALYLGLRGNASTPFDGYLHGFILVDRVATPTEIADCETWMRSRYGFTA